MLSSQLFRAEKSPRKFNSFPTNEDDLGHVLRMSEDKVESLEEATPLIEDAIRTRKAAGDFHRWLDDLKKESHIERRV